MRSGEGEEGEEGEEEGGEEDGQVKSVLAVTNKYINYIS